MGRGGGDILDSKSKIYLVPSPPPPLTSEELPTPLGLHPDFPHVCMWVVSRTRMLFSHPEYIAWSGQVPRYSGTQRMYSLVGPCEDPELCYKLYIYVHRKQKLCSDVSIIESNFWSQILSTLLTHSDPGACFNKHEGRPPGSRTILLWTNNMGGWSVAWADGPSLLVKQLPGLDRWTQVFPRFRTSLKVCNFKHNVEFSDCEFEDWDLINESCLILLSKIHLRFGNLKLGQISVLGILKIVHI